MDMPNKELQQYFYESQFDNEYEQYLLLDVLGEYDVFSILYNNTSNIIKKKRDAILHLYLWDLNYCIKGEILSTDSECFQMHERWWSDNRKKDVLNCLKEKNEDLSKLIFDIIKNWKILRDELFKEDYDELKQCNTAEKYLQFIEEHPNTYPEYFLHAKYHIARLSHTPFIELNEVKTDYGDCDWVKNIECETTKSGITYMITKESGLNEEERQLIVSFLEDFSNKQMGNNDARLLVANNVVTECIWNIVMGTSNPFGSRIEHLSKMIQYNDTAKFIEKLQELVCVKFRIPNTSEINIIRSDIHSQVEKQLHEWEWCEADNENSGKAPVWCLLEQCDDNKPKTHLVEIKECYATCRLVLDAKNDKMNVLL